MTMVEEKLKLPAWPVGDLKESADVLLGWISPLGNEKELTSLKEKLRFFQEERGAILQESLKAKAKESDQWFHKLWDELYLNYRGPLPLDMNFFFELSTKSCLKEDYLNRAARFLLACRDAFRELEKGSFPQDGLCPSAFFRLFCTRIAGANADTLKYTPKNKPLCFILLYKGQMSEISLEDHSLSPHSLSSLKKALELACQQTRPSLDLTSMSTGNRQEAFKIKQELCSIEENDLFYEKLQNALCILSIEEKTPSSPSSWHQKLMGAASNRFFDKSLQLIITPDGSMGVNIEHSPSDAGPWLVLFDYIDEKMSKERPERQESFTVNSTPLLWKSTPLLEELLKKEKEHFSTKLSSLQYRSCLFSEIGKDLIKSMRISPDAFIQLSIQTAQYKTFGELNSCYESVSMRHYRYGRTECTRPCTQEAKELALAMIQNAPAPKLIELLHTAANAHIQRIRQCQNQKAPLRHFFALKKMEEELFPQSPSSLFQDPLYQRLHYDKISTSSSSSKSISAFGFAPVVPDGIAVGYSLYPDKLHLGISWYQAYEKQGLAFCENFAASIQTFIELLK